MAAASLGLAVPVAATGGVTIRQAAVGGQRAQRHAEAARKLRAALALQPDHVPAWQWLRALETPGRRPGPSS